MCDPICTGRSPVFRMTSSMRSSGPRSPLSSTVPWAVRMAPGPVDAVPATVSPSFGSGWDCGGAGSGDRVVEGDEFATIRERRLDLHIGDHLGDALHHLVAGQH